MLVGLLLCSARQVDQPRVAALQHGLRFGKLKKIECMSQRVALLLLWCCRATLIRHSMVTNSNRTPAFP
jgi:hypothetical protein